jgi:flagellar motility protein MotE (MotC chaperone)
MKKNGLLFILMMTFSLLNVVHAQDKNNSNEMNKGEDKEKTYTEFELKEEVEKRLEEKLKKVKTGSLVGFSRELLQKEEKLKLEELALKKREEQLEINKQSLNKKLVEFQGQQNKILGCIDGNRKDENKRVQHMVDTIAGMRPATAADVLSVQDSEISVKILGHLGPEKVSKIFNSMDKEISARLQKQYMNMKK